MKLSEFIAMCKAQNWEEMRSFLSCSSSVDYKILITAIFNEYHPDKDIRNSFGLNIWNERLSCDVLSHIASMYIGAVDLMDFTNAYLLAGDENGLKDKQVAQAIFAYIKKNRVNLAPHLDSESLSQKDKDVMRALFPDLTITKQEREAYFRKQFAKQAKEKIGFFQAKDNIKPLLNSLFALEDYEYNFYISRPSNLLGIKHDEYKGNIYFKEDICTDYVRKFAAVLEKIGLSANFYNFPNQFGKQRGIQLFVTPQLMEKKLTEFQQFCVNSQSDATNEGFSNAKNLLAELNELKKKESDYTYEQGL